MLWGKTPQLSVLILLDVAQGHMPSARLLTEYRLPQFIDVAKAVRYIFPQPLSLSDCIIHCSQGNMRLLSATLQKNEVF